MSTPVTRVCKKCNNIILEAHAYELGDDRWHTNCFKCSECESLLGCNSNFLVLGDGNLICSNCTYNCKQCGKKIDDLAILTGDQAYCSNCFKCRACKLKIEDLRYARTSKGLFCMSCHEKLVAKKKKYDLKKRQLAQLEHLLRPDLDLALAALSPAGSLLLLPSELYSQRNSSSASVLNKQLPPQPMLGLSPLGDDPPKMDAGSPAGNGALANSTSVHGPTRAAANSGVTLPAANGAATNGTANGAPNTNGHLPLSAPPVSSLVPGAYPLVPSLTNLATSLAPSQDLPTNASTVSLAADIEEVNDLDDELNLRRMREKLQRRFERLANSETLDPKDDSAVLDLLESFSGQNTPNTVYTVTDTADSVLAVLLKTDKENARPVASLRDSESDKTKLNLSLDPGSPHKNILLLSPNQFHDREFHSAKSVNSDAVSLSLLAEDIARQRSAASSPMAKVNRQARVVEMNDDVATSEITTDSVNDSEHTFTTTLGMLGVSPFSEKTPQLEHGAVYQMSTPKKSPAGLNHAVLSPPPRLALPEVPSTPQPKTLQESFEPRGLGLEGVEFLRPSKAAPPTPAVTNLEDTIDEDQDEEEHTLKKLSARRKMSLKHKRSTSGGLSFGGKFGFFKSKDDEQKGHARHVLEGSIQGLAYVTPPLPFTSPLRQRVFRDNHARSTSDTQFITQPESEMYKNELELRSMRVEVYQLENRRQNLLADNMKLSSDKNRLQEAIKALTKRLETETATFEELEQKIEQLKNEKKTLVDENSRLTEQNTHLKHKPTISDPVRAEPLRVESTTPYRQDSWNDTIEAEDAETHKATRLKFWRRPKVSMAPHLVNTQSGSSLQLLAAIGPGASASNGITGGQPQQTHKLSQLYSSNAIQIPNLNTEDSGARKALNTFMSKSRSTTILDSFTNGSGNNGEAPLFASTIQRRAIYENEKVPLILTKCIEEVESRGLDAEGIYRISGGSSAVTAIENAFAALSNNPHMDKKQMAKLNDALSGDINAVTSALKRYLRKLPDPLIPYALYNDFIRVGQNTNASANERCEELVTRVLSRLPPANRHALFLLGKHLEVVNLYNSVNRMNFKNLSVVFAPTIARDATGEREMTDMGPRNDATELLLSHFNVVLAGYDG